MKKNIFNFLLCVWTVIVLMTVFCVSSYASENTITPGVAVEIYSENFNSGYYTFVPEVSGVYQIESYGSVDTIVTLYDSEGNELAYSDDIGEENLNFSLRYSFRAGKAYYFRFDAYTHFQYENVTVLLKSTSAIDKDSIADVKLTFSSVFENLSGSMDIFDVRGDFFRYSYNVIGVEIILKSSEVITCLPEEVEELTGLVLSVRDSQSYDNQWALGENEVEVSLGAYKETAFVTVSPNAFEKITVPDREVIINTNGETKITADGEEWYRYFIQYIGSDIVLEMGGETITGSVDDIFEKTGFSFEFTSNQSAENPWGAGTHRIDYTFMGHSGSYNLTVVECPVEGMEIEKLTLVEAYDGFEAVEDSGSYFYYFAYEPEKVKITLTDGNTVTGSYAELSKYFGYDFHFENTQSAENPWTVGVYKVAYSFMGYSSEYDVEIIPCPVKSISVKNVSLYYESEGTYYYNDEGKKVFYYESAPDEMTVNFTDGTSVSGDAEGIEELTGYKVHIDDSQDSTDWGVGEFESSVSFLGVRADYKVKISASPVKSVNIEALQLYEEIDGKLCEDASGYLYDIRPEKVTVIYKDGSAVVGNADEIEKQTGYRLHCSDGQKYAQGKHNATATFMGVKGNYTVTVSKNPVSEIEIITPETGKTYVEGELYDLNGAVLKVTYTDGTQEECKITHNLYDKTATVYLKKLGRSVSFDAAETVKLGAGRVSIDLFGKNTAVNVGCDTRAVGSVSLSATAEENPVMTLGFTDGTTVNAEVLCIVNGKGIYTYDYLGKEKAVILVTDKGSFNALVKNKADGTKLCFEDFAEGSLDVALPDDMDYTSSLELEKARLIYSFYGNSSDFDGYFTRGNADALMSIAAAMSDKGTPKASYKDYYIYTKAEIEKCLKDAFRITNINLSFSYNYDSKTDSVRVEKLGCLDNPLEGCLYDITYPVSFTVDSGCLKAVCDFTDGGRAEFYFDADGKTEAYTVYEPLVHIHTPVARFGTAATYVSVGYTDSVACSDCGEVFLARKTVAKKVLGKTSKITSTTSTSAIKLDWTAVKDATGYEVYYKKGGSWKKCATTTARTVTFSKLSAGKKYTFAVRAYIKQSGKTVRAPSYTTFETSTKAVAPSKVTAKQSSTAIQLNWTACKGATGYRIYRKTSKGWEVAVSTTAKTTATMKGLKAGTKVTYAVRPYIQTANGVVWSSYATYTATTKPAIPTVKVATPSKGKVSVTFSKVSGAEAYLVYYKTGNGGYKLYKTYKAPATCSITSLKSNTNYTFVVRAGIKTTGGWVYGSYKPVTVKTK